MKQCNTYMKPTHIEANVSMMMGMMMSMRRFKRRV